MNSSIDNANKTCYNCGKTFRTPADLIRHKGRKTPCLIREISDADKNNPLRCIYCNKIFSKTNNLNQHFSRCKVKNGGLQTLHDKVKYEENMRIMQEENQRNNKNLEAIISIMREENVQMQAQMQALRDELREAKQLVPTTTTGMTGGVNNGIGVNINNGTVNNTNNTVNVNNYNSPNIDYIKNDFTAFAKLFNRELAGTPIALVEKIWYDPDHPENRALHLVNKKNGETLVIIDGRWVTDNIANIIPVLRHFVYELTQTIMRENSDRLINFSNDMVPTALENARKSDRVIKEDHDLILKKMIDGRELSQPAVEGIVKK
jgi:uncharacterized C2H2 Zn-finger protein